MRIPFVRSGGDESPIAWWEWLFAPIMIPLFIIVVFVGAIVSVPVKFVCRLRQQSREKLLRPRLAAVGRFMEWAEVEAKLIAGVGTLIVEHRSPKGPIREWWTEADVVAAASVPLPTSIRFTAEESQLQSIQALAKCCSAHYTEIETGTAKLTVVPTLRCKRLDPRKYVVVDLGGGLFSAILLVTGRRLSEKYPHGKVVTLLVWFDEPLIFLGDAESVFLAPAEENATADGSRDASERSRDDQYGDHT